MTDQQWQLAWKIYQQVSNTDVPTRDNLQRITDDPEVLQELGMLLHSTSNPETYAKPLLPAALQPGDQVGRFVIRELVGTGSFGRVYAARDIELSRPVALKVLHLSGEYSYTRSFREARAASALNHPGILTIYDVLQTGSSFVIAMELVEGESLRRRLGRPLSLSEVCLLGAQIARALSVSHAAGIIHGDLKPENIMLRPDGYIKLLDFGLAQAFEPSVDNVTEPIHRLAGTFNYMAPELFAGRSVTFASDCFALGLLLSEMASGVRTASGSLPASLQLLTERLLADDPADRPPANKVAQTLEEIGLLPKQRLRHTRLLLSVPLAAAALLLVFFWPTAHQTAPIHPDQSAPDQIQQAVNQMRPASYKLYLQAHFAELQHTPKQTLKAIQLYKEALRLDPASAELHSRLAGEYMQTLEYSLLPVDKAQQLAENEAQTALRLGSSGAHTTLAELKEARGDWTGAEEEFRRARHPNSSYSLLLSQIGRHDEAMRELEQVRKKQPWALDYMTQVGTALYLARRYQSAIAQEKNVLAIEPHFYGAGAWLTEALLAAHQPDEALATFRNHLTPVENASYFAALHVYCYAASGDLANAKRLLAQMNAPPAGIHTAPGDLATAYVGVGDFTKAAEYLQKAYELHDSELEYLKVEPLYDPMRADRRFQEILNQINFPR